MRLRGGSGPATTVGRRVTDRAPVKAVMGLSACPCSSFLSSSHTCRRQHHSTLCNTLFMWHENMHKIWHQDSATVHSLLLVAVGSHACPSFRHSSTEHV